MTTPGGPESLASPEEVAEEVAEEVSAHDAVAARAEATAEFVYGTTAVLIALSGLEIVGGVAPEAAAAITLAGAVAMWLSHAYAQYLGAHVAHGQALARGEITRSLRRSAPIVVAAVPATLLLAGAVAGLWQVRFAIFAANLLAIVVLAVAGWIGARTAQAGLMVAFAWAATTASIGIGIVVIESLLHH